MRALLLVTTLLVLAPGLAARAEDTPAAALPAITVSTVETRALRDRVIATGLIAPVETVQVAPLIEGQPIETLLADVGDSVAAGQVLALLSKSSLDLQKSQLLAALAAAQAAVAQARAQVQEAETAAAEAARVGRRMTTLLGQGTVAQAAADSAGAAATAAAARIDIARQAAEVATAQVAQVEAQIATLDLQLDRTEVKAPVAGEITARNAVVGAIASAGGAPMFTLIREGALELTVDVAEADILRLAPGQTVGLRLVGGTQLTGSVRLVEPAINTATRLGRARIAVDDSSAVRAGMFAEADILIAEREALAIPVTAVGADPGGAAVMAVADGTVARVVITTGIRDAGWVEVTAGLQAGDRVVTKAGTFVRDGDRVQPVAASQ